MGLRGRLRPPGRTLPASAGATFGGAVGQLGAVGGAAAGVSASLDAGTAYGRIHNALKNTEGTADLNIHATTTQGDITARSL